MHASALLCGSALADMFSAWAGQAADSARETEDGGDRANLCSSVSQAYAVHRLEAAAGQTPDAST
eukprot:scaffold352018_cov35-Prasinocladus_malaysianus.AAC.1